ncbi:MAG: glycosyltransferase [Chloroflexota bacterium]
MRILFLTPQLPYPPHKGTSLRNLHLIKGLAASHEVHLLTFAEGGASLALPGQLKELCSSVQVVAAPKRSLLKRLASLLCSPYPDMASRLVSLEFASKLRDALRLLAPEAIQVEGLEMARYYLDMPPSAESPAVVLDEHNAEYVLQKRAFEVERRMLPRWFAALYSLIQWQKLERYERIACRRATAVITVSDEDRQALLRMNPGLDATVVPNGVDTTYFLPWPAKRREGSTLLFTGTMDFRPNVDAAVWFVDEVFPLVRRDVPQARLLIVGGSPTRKVKALGSASVEVTGFVEDVRPYMAEAAVYVIPIRIGGGVRFKALEAMASGLPVVSTTMGVEGISVRVGDDLLLADDASSFASAVVRLLRDPELGQQMASRARRLIEQQYDWNAIMPRLDELYLRLSQTRGAYR